jgi:hypothetical protein
LGVGEKENDRPPKETITGIKIVNKAEDYPKHSSYAQGNKYIDRC